VVENRAGGSGTIGAGEVSRAAPDGTTFLVNASAHVIVPHLQAGIPIDALADFTPVTELVKVPLILVVNAASPIRGVADLLAAARVAPGRMTYASSSIGGAPHLAGELFKHLAGVELTHVPYRGSGPALNDLLAGNVAVMFDSLASSAGHVREGRLRAIAATTAARLPAFPDLPTVAESGLPGFEISTWYGLWGPPRLPDALARRMQAALAAGLRAPEHAARLAALGAEPVVSEPAAFAAFVREDLAYKERMIRVSGARVE